MNVISSTYFSAERQDGVCRGTLWRTNAIQDTGRTVDYCTVTANLLDCYESRTAWARGDFPLASLTVVGASAMEDDISFRLVTNQGSHLQCQATSKPCRNLWLAALLSGLELALQQAGNAAELTALTPPSPPSRRFAVRRADSYCRSCGANATPQKVVHATVAPLPQYGMEQRVALCRDCALAQGLWMHVQTYHWALQTAQHERIAFKQGRDLCFQVISAPENTTTTTATAVSTTTSIETTAEQATAAATTPSEDEDSSWTNVSGGSRSTPSPPDQWHTVEHSPSSSSNNNNWIDVPPTSATTKALWQVVKSRDFELYAQQSPLLHKLQQQFLQGLLGVNEFLAQLKAERDDAVELAALKQQAFRLAGDMGSALQLLLTTTSSTSADSIDLLVCILDFLLDLCAQGETAAVAFFWPQLCHLHLRMLPPETAAQVIRVDLMEDFLLTVAARYSIQLALELVWSHTADLEESLESSSVAEMNTACRKRRFAVLRFVCELESLLFDFDGGWGGGSVALGRMLSPTGHQVDLLKEQMQKIQELRLKQPARLSQSARLDLLSQDKRQLPPEEAADEKLRIAKNADYFSCHLIFTRRLSDIAEKLRFMDVNERAAALEEELSLLNASGTMGGDPLNKVRDHLLRVVRVPNTEGHVFRSKERTPVLLLMEVIDEGAEAEDTENELVPEEKDESDTARGADEAPASDVCESGSIPACSHPESEFDDFGDVRKSPKGALKRFDESEGIAANDPTTPKRDVETMVNNAAVQQLQELVLPDLGAKFDADENEKGEAAPEEVATLPAAHSGAEASTGEFVAEGVKEGDSGIKASACEEEEAAAAHMQDVAIPAEPSIVKLNTNDGAIKDKKEADTAFGATLESEPDNSGMKTREDEVEQEEAAPVKEVDIFAEQSEVVSGTASESIPVLTSSDSTLSNTESKRPSKKMSALGHLKGNSGSSGQNTNTLAPTGDVRRQVLNAIMMRGIEGNAIAAGTAISVQRSLQELERKRATELLLKGDASTSSPNKEKSENDDDVTAENTRESLAALGLSIKNDEELFVHTEEDEIMEAIRLLLIQNRVAQGKLSPADAAKVLQHASLNRTASNASLPLGSEGQAGGDDEVATIDAGDVDRRLVGCGPIPPAVLQALTLWKGGLVTNAELLELVKKDAAFVRHSVLLDAENVDKLNEDSAFWGRFAFGERWAEKKSRIASSSPQGTMAGWDLMGVIVKSNDDLRQESFVMQLIELCQEAFDLAGLELWVNPYRILATGRTTGVIEMVRNAMSFDALKKRPGYGKGGLREHLQRMTEFTVDPGEAFKSAQLNFVRSLAAYSLMSYMFLFKDRHNGNLLLDTAGHVIHIDFGFVFGIAPGGSFSLEMSTPFKLTEEMLEVMGGLRSPLFSEFVTLFCCGFLALQSYRDTFLTIVEIMCEGSTFKCFEGKDTKEFLEKLTERFCPDKTKEETVSFALDLIKQATTSYGTRQYDIYQYMSQGIAT